jgi:hypothetical protein
MTSPKRHEIVSKIIGPLVLSDNSISDRWHQRIVALSTNLVLEIIRSGNLAEELLETFQVLLKQLIALVGNTSSHASDDQVSESNLT